MIIPPPLIGVSNESPSIGLDAQVGAGLATGLGEELVTRNFQGRYWPVLQAHWK